MSDYSGMDFSSDAVMEAPEAGLSEAVEPAEASTPVESTTETEAPASTTEVSTETEAPGEVIETTPGVFEIDGVQVTLEEAKAGFMKNADYTRKTQELAAQRQELQRALAIQTAFEADPQATLKALAEAAGLDFQAAPINPTEGMDPEQIRLAELDARVAKFEAAETERAISNEVAALTAKYGEVDTETLFAHAVRGGFQSLESAYRDMNFDTLLTAKAAEDKAASAEAARLEAKRAAEAVSTVAGSPASQSAPPPATYGSFRESFAAAKKTLGFD